MDLDNITVLREGDGGPRGAGVWQQRHWFKKTNSKLNWLKKTRDKMNSRGMKYNTNDMSGIISEMLLINE